MLRKIVNMIMGSSTSTEVDQRTHFERVLDSVEAPVRERLQKQPDQDPLEVLAIEVMREVTQGQEVNAQAARAFFSVLAENDQLAAGEQLNDREVTLLQHLLLDYFAGADQVRARANEVLALIEQKFSQGAFTQARILLQIFETDDETRLNNERNLFYEDMILRLGVRRRHEINPREQQALHEALSVVDLERPASICAAFDLLAREYYIEFCFALRDPRRLTTWRDIAASSTEPDAEERTLSYVPARRWTRPQLTPKRTLLDLTLEHLAPDAPRKHIQTLTRMCYFLLLASGDTGFEDYLYTYLTWCRERWGVDARRLLPRLHRASVLEERGLQETLDAIHDAFFADPLSARADLTDRAALQAAWRGFLDVLREIDVNQIPPGHYDLGGLLLDHLSDFAPPDPYFAFKVHRLT